MWGVYRETVEVAVPEVGAAVRFVAVRLVPAYLEPWEVVPDGVVDPASGEV